MAYATPATVREALSPEGSEQGNATAAGLSDGALGDAIAEATSEVDARLDGAPFTETPPVVAAITRDIAAYLATLTHRKGNPLPQNHPVLLRYQRAEQLLGLGAQGKLDLGAGQPDAALAQVVNQYSGSLWDLQDLGIGPGRPSENDPLSWPPWVG